MRNYLAAECYKIFRRKYLYITLLVVLALEGLLIWGYWFTWSHGNTGVDFSGSLMTLFMMVSIGLYAAILTGDMVFSEQYKYNTLKNEVAYGTPRPRIYLGKLMVATLVALMAAVVMVGVYLGFCWILLPHNEADGSALATLGYVLAGALPLWLGAQALTMACYFIIPNNTLAAFVVVALLGVLPPILQLCGLLIHPGFEHIRQLMPAVLLEQLYQRAFQTDYLGLCWIVGLVLTVAATLVGIVTFQKREIR